MLLGWKPASYNIRTMSVALISQHSHLVKYRYQLTTFALSEVSLSTYNIRTKPFASETHNIRN